jgi:hypothetical protein
MVCFFEFVLPNDLFTIQFYFNLHQLNFFNAHKIWMVHKWVLGHIILNILIPFINTIVGYSHLSSKDAINNEMQNNENQ